MQTWILLLLPLLAGWIGWLTNRLAIRFLFRPRKPWRCFGLTFQGLIPRRKKDLAEKISSTVAAQILPGEAIAEEIRRLDVSSYTTGLAERLVNEVLLERMKKVPLISSLLSPSTITQIKTWVEKELQKEAGRMLEQVGDDVSSRIDLAGIMRRRIEEFEDEKLEEVVTTVAQKEFRAIEWWGFVIGFVVGCAQVGIVVLAG